MKSFVDTSGLISLLHPDHEFNEKASTVLGRANQEGTIIINQIVYSELAAGVYFDNEEKLNSFLQDTGIRMETPGNSVAYGAGSKFRSYIENRGKKLQCPSCGNEDIFECNECGGAITSRLHIPSDFLIGTHAEKEADQLITFDGGFYSTYFDVEVVGIVN
ncbi:MAG: PIN domain-containing protein [Halobacteria archaeon]